MGWSLTIVAYEKTKQFFFSLFEQFLDHEVIFEVALQKQPPGGVL